MQKTSQLVEVKGLPSGSAAGKLEVCMDVLRTFIKLAYSKMCSSYTSLPISMLWGDEKIQWMGELDACSAKIF